MKVLALAFEILQDLPHEERLVGSDERVKPTRSSDPSDGCGEQRGSRKIKCE
jgi:hypothetical protein